MKRKVMSACELILCDYQHDAIQMLDLICSIIDLYKNKCRLRAAPVHAVPDYCDTCVCKKGLGTQFYDFRFRQSSLPDGVHLLSQHLNASHSCYFRVEVSVDADGQVLEMNVTMRTPRGLDQIVINPSTLSIAVNGAVQTLPSDDLYGSTDIRLSQAATLLVIQRAACGQKFSTDGRRFYVRLHPGAAASTAASAAASSTATSTAASSATGICGTCHGPH